MKIPSFYKKSNSRRVPENNTYVCSVHMMQMIKQHVKTLCKSNYLTGSQIYIAMRFFGRLIFAASLDEMKYIVNLGYVIFGSISLLC